MDFDQLVTFQEVAKLGSFSRAGQKVFRSQSAVSAQIRQLEQEYGDRLLDRSGKDVTLTPAGRVLFAYAERLLKVMAPAASDALETRPVSTAVNSVRNDGPDLIAPLAEPGEPGTE